MIIIFGPYTVLSVHNLQFSPNYATQNYKFHLIDYEIIESNDNIILNKLNSYPSALLSTIHLLKLMTLYQKTAFVFQLAMAWQSNELNLRVVSSIRCTDALDLNISQMTLVECFLEIFYFPIGKESFILISIIDEKTFVILIG